MSAPFKPDPGARRRAKLQLGAAADAVFTLGQIISLGKIGVKTAHVHLAGIQIDAAFGTRQANPEWPFHHFYAREWLKIVGLQRRIQRLDKIAGKAKLAPESQERVARLYLDKMGQRVIRQDSRAEEYAGVQTRQRFAQPR